ncbi:hypothetical protein AVEN_80776-1 [Araneus ventricosus]|uniref:Uncharacterized protein n=1 Tax=Araneus ventricosus TaxID=182803 RepID=A0A4Y2K4M6_ARAVE|nr:hypothetical protein AVEN_240929-1 [Araneus ventricosus]GBM96783.1 hypothetical protein AVEN_16632-1 [Araneus ventricosus]GBM96839.1 hypothetical protein AVEN_80776-1 [Araneus ventricosus]
MFGEMITWFRHAERDGQQPNGIKLQRISHFPADTMIGVIEIEPFKETCKSPMASGELDNIRPVAQRITRLTTVQGYGMSETFGMILWISLPASPSSQSVCHF